MYLCNVFLIWYCYCIVVYWENTSFHFISFYASNAVCMYSMQCAYNAACMHEMLCACIQCSVHTMQHVCMKCFVHVFNAVCIPCSMYVWNALCMYSMQCAYHAACMHAMQCVHAMQCAWNAACMHIMQCVCMQCSVCACSIKLFLLSKIWYISDKQTNKHKQLHNYNIIQTNILDILALHTSEVVIELLVLLHTV